jgi:hypothetical protein
VLPTTILRLRITLVFKSRPFDDGIALLLARAARLQDTDFAMVSQEVLEHVTAAHKSVPTSAHGRRRRSANRPGALTHLIREAPRRSLGFDPCVP